MGHQANYSEDTARAIDAEVRRIVMDGYEVANKVLRDNVDQLKQIAEALLEYETIDGEDIETVLRGGRIERRPPPAPRPPAVEASKEKRPSASSPVPPSSRTSPKKPSLPLIPRAIL